MTLIRNLIISLSLVSSLVGCTTLSSTASTDAVKQAATVDMANTANAADAVIQGVFFG